MDKAKPASFEGGKDQLEPEVETPSKTNHKNREVYWLVGGIAVVGLIIIAYKLGKQSVFPLQASPMPSSVSQNSPTPSVDPTANWRKYTNAIDGYNISYPEDWQFEPSENSSVKIVSPCRVIDIKITTSTKVLKSYVTDLYKGLSESDLFSHTRFIIDNQPTLFIKPQGVGELETIYVKNKDRVYALTIGVLYGEGTTEPIQCKNISVSEIDQILSTFKFIDSPKTDTSQVIIYSPASNSLISNPVTVTGKIPSLWVFEATFPVRILDSNRNELALKAADTQGDWTTDAEVEFSVTIDYQTTDKTGFIVINNDNPSGLPDNSKSYEIPIRFQ